VRAVEFHPDGTRVFGATEDHRLVEVTRSELQRIAARVNAATQTPSLTTAVTGARPSERVSAHDMSDELPSADTLSAPEQAAAKLSDEPPTKTRRTGRAKNQPIRQPPANKAAASRSIKSAAARRPLPRNTATANPSAARPSAARPSAARPSAAKRSVA